MCRDLLLRCGSGWFWSSSLWREAPGSSLLSSLGLPANAKRCRQTGSCEGCTIPTVVQTLHTPPAARPFSWHQPCPEPVPFNSAHQCQKQALSPWKSKVLCALAWQSFRTRTEGVRKRPPPLPTPPAPSASGSETRAMPWEALGHWSSRPALP